MAKKEITKNEYLQLVGLMTIAHGNLEQINACERAMVSIVGEQDLDISDYAGLLSDAIFEKNTDVKKCLRNMGINLI